MLQAAVLLGVLCQSIHPAHIFVVSLNDLWTTKKISGHHLFPTHESALYPHFLAIPTQGSSTIHMSQDSVQEISKTRLIHSVCSYKYVNNTYFLVNEEFGYGNSELLLNLSLDDLEHRANVLTFRLLKPSYFCFDPNNHNFHAVWQRPLSPLKHFEISLKQLPEMIASDQRLGRAGYYPDCWQVFDLNGTTVALAIWRKGFGVRYRIQSSHFIEEVLTGMEGTDMHLVAFSVFPRKNKEGAKFWMVWNGDQFSWKSRQIYKSQTIPKDWEFLDDRITSQMRAYDVPSISICAMSKGKVLYEAAYGYADLRQQKQATPQHEYRVASISKTVTSMGIAKLINKNLLSLDSALFGEDGILKQYSVHDSLKRIKVRHLLEHASGGWSHFQRHEFNRNESDHITFVKHLVTGYTLSKPPGDVFTYSNIGYMFLGRVIEQITGTSYEKFIQREVFNAIGVTARIGEQYPGKNEVTYYSKDNASPYNHWNPRLLDSATGWVFTARQLAQLFSDLDVGRNTEYAVISTRSNATRTYGRGIQIGEDGSLFHMGSLSGSEAFAITRDVQVAILSNIRGRQNNVHTGWMHSLARYILDNVDK